MRIRKQQVDWLLDLDYASRTETAGRHGISLGIGSAGRTCNTNVGQGSIEKEQDDER